MFSLTRLVSRYGLFSGEIPSRKESSFAGDKILYFNYDFGFFDNQVKLEDVRR